MSVLIAATRRPLIASTALNPFMPPPVPASSWGVASVSEFDEAMGDAAAEGSGDVVFTTDLEISDTVFVPRVGVPGDPGITIRCAPGVSVKAANLNAAQTRPLFSRALGGGPDNWFTGVVKFVGFRLDGQNFTGQAGTDDSTNLRFNTFGEVVIDRCALIRSRKTVAFLTDVPKVTIRRSFFAHGPKDPVFIKSNGITHDVLVEDNLAIGFGDDFPASHTGPDAVVRRVVVRRNRSFDCNGIVLLGGSEDGTVNGQPAGVYILDNEVYFCKSRGIMIGGDGNFNEGTYPLRNMEVTGNLVENLRRPSSIGEGRYFMKAGAQETIPGTNIVAGNTFRRTVSSAPTVASVYPDHGNLPLRIREWLDLIQCPAEWKSFPEGVYQESSSTGFTTDTNTIGAMSTNIVGWLNQASNASDLNAQIGDNTFDGIDP